MTRTTQTLAPSLAAIARTRMESAEGGPFMICDWAPAIFVHYQVDPIHLRSAVPFELDTRDDRAYVSLVAFRLANFRLCVGGKLVQFVTNNLANACFLNVRTYVRHQGEPGIFFMHEWVTSAVQTLIGPKAYGLPYHRGRVSITGDGLDHLVARASDAHSLGDLTIDARCEPDAAACAAPDSHEEFLAERYTAYAASAGIKRRFRIWHEPWRLAPARVELSNHALLEQSGTWFRHARQVMAFVTPGVSDVWISRPSCIQGPACLTPWSDSPASSSATLASPLSDARASVLTLTPSHKE